MTSKPLGVCEVVEKFVDQNMVADEQSVLHGAGRNLERLHNELAQNQGQKDGNSDRFRRIHERRIFPASVPAGFRLNPGTMFICFLYDVCNGLGRVDLGAIMSI